MCRTDKTTVSTTKKKKQNIYFIIIFIIYFLMLLAVGRRDVEELAPASADREKGEYGNGDVSDVKVKDKPRQVELRELLWHV